MSTTDSDKLINLLTANQVELVQQLLKPYPFDFRLQIIKKAAIQLLSGFSWAQDGKKLCMSFWGLSFKFYAYWNGLFFENSTNTQYLEQGFQPEQALETAIEFEILKLL